MKHQERDLNRFSRDRRNLQELRDSCGHLGIDLFSTTVITESDRESFHLSIRDISRALEYAVVIGIRLSDPVLDTIADAPTWTYYYHYRQVNYALDNAALFITSRCHGMGYRALPIPASQIMDWTRLRGHLSHRSIAEKAGLGWRGKNNLLINPDFGACVRYATVLTDMPLPSPQPAQVEMECGDCRACQDICPAGAIGDDLSDFSVDRCAAQLRRFSRSEKLNTMICGLCVKVCKGKLNN
ncbi:MAG: hypothetical protein GF417_00950 [Candidatus Latescibacteria bacterium]|nr:hypothetical protein [bacterium]MBD3422994.1 hypothetical protein [Candidatus Latescibacterota bacterium]